jgi:hypothetical protein
MDVASAETATAPTHRVPLHPSRSDDRVLAGDDGDNDPDFVTLVELNHGSLATALLYMVAQDANDGASRVPWRFLVAACIPIHKRCDYRLFL